MKLAKVFIFLLILCIKVEAQTIFKVVAVEGEVSNSKKEQVRNLDQLRPNEKITIGENGFLALIDNSKNIYEYTGPSKVNLQSSTNLKLNFLEFSSLKTLYLTNNTPIISHFTNEIELISPFNHEVKFQLGENLCLEWTDIQNIKNARFKVFVLNLLEDTLYTVNTIENKVVIENGVLRLNGKSKVYLIGIQSLASNQISPMYQMKIEENRDYRMCRKLATDYVLMAFRYENIGQFENAEKNYRMAFELSKRVCFKLILDNFLLRKEQLINGKK